MEWGLADATAFIAIALAAALGGFIAESYGFRLLFILSAIVNIVSLTPYALLVFYKRRLNPDNLLTYYLVMDVVIF